MENFRLKIMLKKHVWNLIKNCCKLTKYEIYKKKKKKINDFLNNYHCTCTK